jgi:hypothetical protein
MIRLIQSGGSMTADGKINRLPISEIHSEAGAQDLVQSERMKPYLAFLKALMGGQDTEPYLVALAALPLEERYVWRVVSALKWAFCDLVSSLFRRGPL